MQSRCHSAARTGCHGLTGGTGDSRQVDGSAGGSVSFAADWVSQLTSSAFPLRMMSRRQQTSRCCLARIDVPTQTAATLQDGSGGHRRGNPTRSKGRAMNPPESPVLPLLRRCLWAPEKKGLRFHDRSEAFFVLQRHCDLSMDRPILTQNIDHVKHLSPCKQHDT